MAAEIGNDVPPQIGRRRITVEENDRIATSGIHIGHFGIEHTDPPPWVTIGGVHISAIHHSSSNACGIRTWLFNPPVQLTCNVVRAYVKQGTLSTIKPVSISNRIAVGRETNSTRSQSAGAGRE